MTIKQNQLDSVEQFISKATVISVTLTKISGNISIFGVRSSSCEGDQQLSINREKYCIDENATTTIINADANALEVKAEQVNSSIIEY